MARSHKIIFVQGPPGSGKDTAGDAMLRRYGEGVRLYQMKMPMDRALRAFFDYDAPSWQVWERSKNAPLHAVNGIPFNGPVTLRQVKINFSEKFAKPTLGRHIFGHLAVERLKHTTLADMTIITDSGFMEEAIPIVDAFGSRNCLSIQLHRPGKSFANDSRSYWALAGVKTIVIHNNLELSMFVDLIDHAIMKWMKEP